MNTLGHTKKTNPIPGGMTRDRGFALISTVAIMVLLVLVVLGMLALSRSEVKKSKLDEHQVIAKTNARMALMIAIGQLQEMAGPDQRVTATASTLSESSKHPHLTGVWRSWEDDFDPSSPPNSYERQKQNKFLGYLASNTDASNLKNSKFAVNGEFDNPIKLVADGSLGKNSNTEDHVYAGVVPITKNGSITGGTAWVVLDEGVKARIGTISHSNNGSMAQQSAALGAADRAALEKAVPEYTPSAPDSGPEALEKKFLNISETALAIPNSDFQQYFHDFSPWSKGVLSSVTDGGLLEDLNLLTNENLPSKYAGKKIYSNQGSGIAASDPSWEQLHEYASLYKKVEMINNTPSIKSSIPIGYEAYTSNDTGTEALKDHEALLTPAPGMILMPSLAKVQVVFSVVSRTAHGGWRRAGATNNLLHLVYSPVVTLHNPYNVALEFESMDVHFKNIPIAFQFYKNNVPQTPQPVIFNKLSAWTANRNDYSKVFSLKLTSADEDTEDPDPDTPVVLQPGEVKVFSPHLPADWSWAKEGAGVVGKDGVLFSDWRSDKTANIPATPGWRGHGIGFDKDWLAPGRSAVIYHSLEDTLKVKFFPQAPEAADGKFVVGVEMRQNGENHKAGILEFDYETTSTLARVVSKDGQASFEYPAAGEPAVTFASIRENNSTPLADYDNLDAFCMFSAYAKTTTGGIADGVEGQYYTKARSFNSTTSNTTLAKLNSEHPSHHSHELNFTTLPSTPDSLLESDLNGRGKFLSGHSTFLGLKFGSTYEVPIAPIQSISQLQHAGLANSAYLPNFDYPVGNSFAHPLMSLSKAIETGSSDYTLLDHSFWLNHQLYDNFYCSGISDYTSNTMGSNKSASKVFEDFLKNSTTDLDQRLTPYIPEGATESSMISDIRSRDGYEKVASYQMLNGRFNLNSTSIPAWKSMLGAINNIEFPILDNESGALQSSSNSQNVFSRLRLPNKHSADEESSKESRWAGYRTISDEQLDELATKIVEEIQERGPFLSVSEFVNRKLSGSSDHMQKGAIQAAIDETNINDIFVDDHTQISSDMVSTYEYRNPEALVGSSAQGAPGYLTQADVLGVLGNSMSVRSDTFTIRAYGESTDSKGKVAARAWCEAVVQRTPEYFDSKDENHTKTEDLRSKTNQEFGRKLKVVSFRWLTAKDI